MICPMAGEIPVMAKLHNPERSSTDQNAATRLRYGQFCIQSVLRSPLIDSHATLPKGR